MSATITWRDWSCAVAVTVADPRHQDAAAAVVREVMGRVERAVSRFREDSDLERVHRNPGVLVPVNALTFHLVGVAIDAARDTGGAVDPTIGADLRRLGYDEDIARVRRRPARAVAPAGPVRRSWRDVVLDPALRRVGVPAGVRLDLGATAKAWAADEAARSVHRSLGDAVLVGIGGDLAAAGRPARDWRVDVAETEGSPAARIGLGSGGLATSSVTGRRWLAADGTSLHHLVDPRTGGPATSVWRTATVWASTALAANVLSTWCLVDGVAASGRLSSARGTARLVGHDGSVTRMGHWPADPPLTVAVAS